MKGEQYQKSILVQVVVEGAKELRAKKRPVATGFEKSELRTYGRVPGCGGRFSISYELVVSSASAIFFSVT